MSNSLRSVIFFLLLQLGLAFASTPNLVPESIRNLESPEHLSAIRYWWGNADEYRQLTTEESYEGRSSLQVQADYPSNKLGIYIPLLKNVKKGKTYTARAYVKCASGAQILIYLYSNTKGKPIDAIFKSYPVRQEWQQVKVTGTLTQDAEEMGIIVRTRDRQVLFYVDCLGLFEGTKAPGEAPRRILPAPQSPDFTMIIPKIDKAPAFTGAQPDSLWQKALLLDRFYRTDGSKSPPARQTAVRLLHDGTSLFARIHCQEEDLSKIICRSLPGKPRWTDERIEFHFNVNGIPNSATKLYFSANKDGVTTSSRLRNLPGSPILCRPFQDRAGWGLEIHLPAVSAGKSGLVGETWSMSIGRFRNREGFEASCLAPIKGHFGQDPRAFQSLVFGNRPDRTAPDCICLSQGSMHVSDNTTGNNRIIFKLTPPRSTTLEVISKIKGKIISRSTSRLPASSVATSHYKVLGRPGEQLIFILRCGSSVLFQSSSDLDLLAPAYRTYRMDDPLYEELLSNELPDRPLVTSWDMPVSPDNFDKAMKYAHPYSLDMRRQELKEANISLEELIAEHYLESPLSRPGKYYRPPKIQGIDELLRNAAAGKFPKPILYGYYSAPAQSADGKNHAVSRDANGYFGWFPDPLTQKLYLDGTRRTLQKIGKSISGMWLGDELVELNLRYGLKMNSPHNLNNPSGFIQQAEKEVREQYGFGKFGIPWGNLPVDDYTPFRRRAYITWMHHHLRETGKKFKKIIKEYNPELAVRSHSNSGDPVVNGFEYAGEFSDILLVQLGEGGGTISPYQQNYAYWVKLSKDLSGISKVMAYPHECDSGYPTGACSEDEMLELYSQVFRAGGSSFAFWPASYGAISRPPVYAHACSEGYPLAWQYILAMSKHIASMPKLKFPATTDTAILLSSDSIKCAPARNTADGLFTMLGPYSRGWFKFISDTTVNLGRDKLEDYQLIYLPYAEFTDEAFCRKLLEYVEKGGILICGDPLVFTHNIDGTSLAQYRKMLFGIEAAATGPRHSSISIGKISAPLQTDFVHVKSTSPKSRVLGKFEDGTPAFVRHPLGKGTAYYFAFRIFSADHLAPSLPWLAFFKQLHQSLGGSTGHNIWRFRFPRMNVKLPDAPQGHCLTGNYAFWDRFKFNDGILHNKFLPGLIRIDRNGQSTLRTFTQSRLTDRRTCFTRTEEYKRKGFAAWCEDFSAAGTYEINIDLQQPHSLTDLKLFWHGTWPENLKVQHALEKNNWQNCQPVIGKARTGRLEAAMSSQSLDCRARYIKINFTKKNTPWILAELEIWGK